jgi:hypothetical protein
MPACRPGRDRLAQKDSRSGRAVAIIVSVTKFHTSWGKYVARVLPSEESGQPGFTYPAMVEGAWVEGLAVEVTPLNGSPWIAYFAKAGPG